MQTMDDSAEALLERYRETSGLCAAEPRLTGSGRAMPVAVRALASESTLGDAAQSTIWLPGRLFRVLGR